ncbi:DUF2798 domain-containing protein [Rhizobium sullae]|uniref:DUF2798 domain-containing protein n=1 Tax=Rhizobium sullae TaxID=50338 RepID=A0ABY5XJ97_RHISU|nr:DUF2798 domain-containing protein [Rhizobium sullae]UWU14181.1 DUF2798 domain-containing protein [Rhizobium sullae]
MFQAKLRKRLGQSTRNPPPGHCAIGSAASFGEIQCPIAKLPKRYNAIVVPFILSMLMRGVASAISIVRTQGIGPLTLAMSPSTWALSWIIAFPVHRIIHR